MHISNQIDFQLFIIIYYKQLKPRREFNVQ